MTEVGESPVKDGVLARRSAWWRYLLPNAATVLSVLFGVLSLEAAIRRRTVSASWWALYGTLTDRLDGALARALHGSSAFGRQLDSLADLLIFGVAPATILYGFFVERPALGWAAGWGHVALGAFAALYVIAAALRLARFNVTAAAPKKSAHYQGVPTTMTAGILLTCTLACFKYASPSWILPERLDHWRLLGPLASDALLAYLPLLLVVGTAAMLSPLRVPRLILRRRRPLDVLALATVLFGYAVGLMRLLPEYLAGGGLLYVGVAVAYHLRTRPLGSPSR